jgi:hypothetical protein
MSVAEVINEIATWTPEERQALAWRLKMIELNDDPAFATEMTRRIDEMEQGDHVSRAEFAEALRGRGLTPP